MSTGPDLVVEQIGAGVTYADGAEAELHALVRTAEDRRAVSDELAGRIRDWPTRYHLSRQRANLLAPLRIEPGRRVLDVGAGAGVLARAGAERGASVVAVEGNPARAEIAAARCRGAGDVRILAGSVDDLDPSERFDVVLCVGVLEYAGAPHGGGVGAEAFLSGLAARVGPGGVMVLAIENQFGLKYLLGHHEDHLDRPMVGVEGYPGAASVRTWSRRRLGGLLTDAGFGAARWLFPFPDYKLPTTILTEDAYADPLLVDQLVRGPVDDHLRSGVFPVDPRAAHAQFVTAGLGPDVANSFLVVAARAAGDVEEVVDPGALAWLCGGDRRRAWRRTRVVERVGGDRRVRVSAPAPGVTGSWLTHDEPVTAPWTMGRTVEQLVLDAWADDDRAQADTVLRRWSGWLAAREQPTVPGAGSPTPFAPADRALPGDHLDVGLANVVDAGDLVLVDREWRVVGGVDAALARYRALWYFARDAVHGAVHRPGDLLRSTVDDLTAELCSVVGVDPAPTRARFLEDEPLLQAEVSGGEAEDHRAAILADGASAGPDRRGRPATPAEVAALRAERDRLAHHVAAAEAELQAWRDRWARIERLVPRRLLALWRRRR